MSNYVFQIVDTILSVSDRLAYFICLFIAGRWKMSM